MLFRSEVVDVEALFGVGGVVVEVALLGELLEVGEVFAGEEEDLAWRPVLRLFMEETALPVTEVGPVDFWALRRLASI